MKSTNTKHDMLPFGLAKTYSDEKKKAQKLKEIIETYPLEEQFAIWAYAIFTSETNVVYPPLAESPFNQPITYLKEEFEDYKTIYNFINWIGVSDRFIDWFKAHNLFRHDKDIFKTNPQTPQDNDKHYKNIQSFLLAVEQTNDKDALKRFEQRLGPTRDQIETVYGLHQRIQLFLPTYDAMSIEDVKTYINKTLPKEEFTALKEKPAIKIPTLDKKAIRAKAASLKNNFIDGLSEYGNDVAIESSAIISKLLYYFTQKSARPHHTFSLVEELIEEAKKTSAQGFIKNDPNWLTKTFSSPRLLPPEKMPIATLVSKAMNLPDAAAADNKLLGEDLKLLNQTIKIIDAYYRILEEHKNALEQERKRLTNLETNNQTNLVSDIMQLNIAETFDETINRLDDSMQIHKIFAMNFLQLAKSTSTARAKLSGLAQLATIIQTPAMQAITELQAHQLRRFRQFGKTIDHKIKEQFGEVAKDISAQNKATPEQTKKTVNIALENMIDRLSNLEKQITPEFEKRQTVAEQAQELLLKKKTNRQEPNFR